MSQRDEFHNIDNPSDGLFRELAPSRTTRIFVGEQAMLSVVTLAPNSQGTLHHHPEEQWGVLLEGSAVRVQGDEEIRVRRGEAKTMVNERSTSCSGDKCPSFPRDHFALMLRPFHIQAQAVGGFMHRRGHTLKLRSARIA
jgi:hypothetical protein